MTEDLTSLKESNTPKKGKLVDVGTTDEPFLMQFSHEHRNKEVIAKKPDMPVIPSYTRSPIPFPESSNLTSSYKFTLISSCVSNCYECTSNINVLGEESKQKHIDNLDHL